MIPYPYPYPWHEAPKWANFAVTNPNGASWWFEHKPKKLLEGMDWASASGQACMIPNETTEIIEERPE